MTYHLCTNDSKYSVLAIKWIFCFGRKKKSFPKKEIRCCRRTQKKCLITIRLRIIIINHFHDKEEDYFSS